MITLYPEDLTGLDPEQETDAAQDGLNLHVRCCGVWEGKGNMMNFAFLSQNICLKTSFLTYQLFVLEGDGEREEGGAMLS